MPATLEAGTIHGYCVGEPWNQQAVFKGIGVPVITDYQLWKNNPEKVFGLTKEFTEQNPNTTGNYQGADPCRHLAGRERQRQPPRCRRNTQRARNMWARIRSHRELDDWYFFEFEKGDKRDIPDFNVFFRYNATYPFYSDAVWYLTQMRRWGQITKPSPTAGMTRSPNPSTSPKSTSKRPDAGGRRSGQRRQISPGTAMVTRHRLPPPTSSTAFPMTARPRTPTSKACQSA
ncbi:ABC transporter substrate-binding protein [Hoeflea alexandrii]